MQATEQLYNQISSYILGELKGEQLITFESALASDENLRKEVQLHKDLANNLLNENERNFKSSLLQITSKKKNSSQLNKKLLWLSVLALLLCLIFISKPFLSDKNQFPTVEEKDAIEKITVPKNNNERNEKEQNTKIDNSKNELIQKVEPEKQNLKKEIPTTKEKIDKNIPMAMVDFKPNNSLDVLINGTTRSSGVAFTLRDKIKDQKYVQDKNCEIYFSGTIDTSANVLDENITFYIFSNKKEAYTNFNPIETLNPKLKQINNGYLLTVQKKINLKPGLYYYILETTDDEELIFINKFVIK